MNEVQTKRGFFHMLGRLWDMGTVAIDAAETSINAVHDLASTAQAHTQHIKKTTLLELNSEAKDLEDSLNPSS